MPPYSTVLIVVVRVLGLGFRGVASANTSTIFSTLHPDMEPTAEHCPAHRSVAAKGTAGVLHRGWALWMRCARGPTTAPDSYALSRWLFVRLMGVVFLIAVLSLWSQIHGLIGETGILPAGTYLQRAHEQMGGKAYLQLPTLCWFGAGRAALNSLCAAGAVLSVLLIVGITPMAALLGLWAIYLSLCVVGQAFLSFQWDTLLLEAGFVTLFWGPWQIKPALRPSCPASSAGHWLLRCLLFKLMFLSGITKWLSGDVTWHALTALHIHYQTQPLPTWIGWHAHHLSGGFHKLCVAGMYVVELLVPILVFAPRRVRHLACFTIVFFQATIAATGNYGFFNLLTAVLCVPLLDDGLLRRLVPQRWTARLDELPRRRRRIWQHGAIWLGAGLVLLLSGLAFLYEMTRTT